MSSGGGRSNRACRVVDKCDNEEAQGMRHLSLAVLNRSREYAILG